MKDRLKEIRQRVLDGRLYANSPTLAIRDLGYLLGAIDQTHRVLAKRCGCPCAWCSDCIDAITALLPDDAIKEPD